MKVGMKVSMPGRNGTTTVGALLYAHGTADDNEPYALVSENRTFLQGIWGMIGSGDARRDAILPPSAMARNHIQRWLGCGGADKPLPTVSAGKATCYEIQ
eukprot:gene16575-18522_t